MPPGLMHVDEQLWTTKEAFRKPQAVSSSLTIGSALRLHSLRTSSFRACTFSAIISATRFHR